MTEPKKRGWIKWVVGITVFILAVTGWAAWEIGKFIKRLEKMDIVVEEVANGGTETLTREGRNTHPQFSPDGSQIVFVYTDASFKSRSQIRVMNLSDHSVRTLVDDDHFNYLPQWSPDGKKILYASRGGVDRPESLRIFSMDAGTTEEIATGLNLDEGPFLSPDGLRVLFSEGDPGSAELYLLPITGGEKKKLTETDNFLFEPTHPTWAPDSKRIAYFSFTSFVVADTDGKRLDSVDLTGLNNFNSPLFFPKDPNSVFFVARPARDMSLKSNFYILSLENKTFEAIRGGRGLAEIGYRLSPDGARLVYSKPRD